MGGNLRHKQIEGFPEAQRISTYVMQRIISEINIGSGCTTWTPRTVGEKDTHGDIDLLVLSEHIQAVRGTLIDFSWKNPKTNRSYLHELSQDPNSLDNFMCEFVIGDTSYIVQVDLIKTPENIFSFAYGYFSFNDLGNLIGRIAHRRGMKFGHDGLWYVHRRGDRVLAEILVSDDFFDALRYLGFDDDKWHPGFETFEEMFEWVARSEYFESSAYPLEHQNHRARTRDRKRKTYNMFLDWLEENGYDMSYVPSKKEEAIAQLFNDFPGVSQQVNAAEEADDLRMAYKKRINGIKVNELTGTEGKDLGSLMNIVKTVLPVSWQTVNLSDEAIACGVTFAQHLWREL